MSGFVCPHCENCSNLFSTGGGERLAEECSVPFLGRIPIDPALGEALERGDNFLDRFPKSQVAAAIGKIVAPLLALSADETPVADAGSGSTQAVPDTPNTDTEMA